MTTNHTQYIEIEYFPLDRFLFFWSNRKRKSMWRVNVCIFLLELYFVSVSNRILRKLKTTKKENNRNTKINSISAWTNDRKPLEYSCERIKIIETVPCLHPHLIHGKRDGTDDDDRASCGWSSIGWHYAGRRTGSQTLFFFHFSFSIWLIYRIF